MMRRLVACSIVLIAGYAYAQDEEPPFQIDMIVNYDGNFVSGSWVPVDVFVKNDREDMSGYIELRMYNGSNVLSPIYTIPADSPLGSNKRFRVNAKPQHANRITANFINGRRPVLSTPTYQDLVPADPEDLQALLLTEDPADLGFLNVLLHRIDGSNKRRLFRKWVHTEISNRLSENPLCYEPNAFVFVDEFVSDRVAPDRRDAITRYVNSGGILVLMTGANAGFHRGTWIEDLAGVRIGAPEVVSEADLAEAFPENKREGLNPQKTFQFAPIEPARENSRVIKAGDRTLSILRPVGQGYVITFAVDADSKALQGNPGYEDLWADILTHDLGRFELDLATGVPSIRNWLFNMAGIKMFSRGRVMTYLAAYFLIGIVGSWVVANAMRRREWMWVGMCLASVGFSAYALIFGTAGRASTTEVERIEFIQMAAGSSVARLDTLLGVVSPRTRAYAIPFDNEPLGISPADFYADYNFGTGTDGDPFHVFTGDPYGVNDFRIGASELRFLHFTEDVYAPGELKSNLSFDNGEIIGTVTNETGYTLKTPILVFNGRVYSGFGVDGEIRFQRYPDLGIEEAFDERWITPSGFDYYEFMIMRDVVPRHAFDQNTGYCIAWTDAPPMSMTAPDEGDIVFNVQRSMLIAELPVKIETTHAQRLTPRWAFVDREVGLSEIPLTPESEILLRAENHDEARTLEGLKFFRGYNNMFHGQHFFAGDGVDEQEATILIDWKDAEESEGPLVIEISGRRHLVSSIQLRVYRDSNGDEFDLIQPSIVGYGSFSDGPRLDTAVFYIDDFERYAVRSPQINLSSFGLDETNTEIEPATIRLSISRSNMPMNRRKYQDRYTFLTSVIQTREISTSDFPAWQ